MVRVIPLKPEMVLRILTRLGFQSIRQKGSHILLKHPDGRTTVVPYHKGEDIGRGLMASILRDIDLSWEEFIKHQ